MTILEKLKERLKRIQIAIHEIESLSSSNKDKAKNILKSVSGRKWTPEQRKKFMTYLKNRKKL